MIIQPARSWFFLSSACLVAALLSTAQIFVRQRLQGGHPELLQLATLNLVAWAPWIPIASFALSLQRRLPLSRSTFPRTAFLHVTAALVACFSFLAYLALFRLATNGPAINVQTLWTAFGTEVGDFFLVCLLLYGLLLSLGMRRTANHDNQPPVPQHHATTVSQLEIRSQGRTRYVETPAIDWIAAEGSYVRLHVGRDSFLLRASLTALARKLAGSGFSRIHRSSIVNRKRIVELQPLGKGDAKIKLIDGTILRMSRRFRANLVGPDRPGTNATLLLCPTLEHHPINNNPGPT